MDKQVAALEALKAMTCITITPAQAAAVLGCTPQYIRIAARSAPDALGFPVVVYGKPTRRNPHGSRVKIMRSAFIRFVEGGRKNTRRKPHDEKNEDAPDRKPFDRRRAP